MDNDTKFAIAALVPRLRRFAYALTGNREDGDDLVQTAYVKALNRLDQFEPGTKLHSWMFRIIRNAHIDEMRGRSRFRRDENPNSIDFLSDSGLGARKAESQLLLSRVLEEISKLPADQRSVLALVAIEGLAYKEAAEILDIPIGTVMSRLSRARARLMPLLEA